MKQVVFTCEECGVSSPGDKEYPVLEPKDWTKIDITIRTGWASKDKTESEYYYCPECFRKLQDNFMLEEDVIKKASKPLKGDSFFSKVLRFFKNESLLSKWICLIIWWIFCILLMTKILHIW